MVMSTLWRAEEPDGLVFKDFVRTIFREKHLRLESLDGTETMFGNRSITD